KEDWRGSETAYRPVTAPPPLSRITDESCFDGIQGYVTDGIIQVPFFLNKRGIKAFLEEVTRFLVLPVETFAVIAIELMHPLGEIRLRRLDQQVVVGVHQAVSVAFPVELTDYLGELLEEVVTVIVTQVNILL
ncbi:MAG: hypothetical protein L6433_07900, partial [Actinomycetia bacterium]|nr:hypothetical protein [Actinomycetes bacterium]